MQGLLTRSALLILVLPLWLRPQSGDSLGLLQNVGARNYASLDGLWEAIVDPLENGFYSHRYTEREDGYFKNAKMESPSDLIEYDFDTDRKLKVPGDWNTQEEKLYYYEGTVWYKREFVFKGNWDHVQYLHFGAVNYEATVYLNGEKLGRHIGGYTSFQFEVTGKLKKRNNLLVVKVDNKRKREAVPTVNSDWWNYGGITRSVRLITVPKTHIGDYSIHLKDGDARTVEGWITVVNAEDGAPVNVGIPELQISVNATVKNGRAEFSMKAAPKLWSPTDPKLYEVVLNAGDDQVMDAIGFRTIATKGSNILLNGSPIFLKGISIHEEAPFKTGRVTTVEQCRTLLNWAKELGCNFVRLAHYPHSEAMVREAEKMGLLIWSEIPVYWTVLFDNPSTYANAENQLTEMVTRDKNRAAVVLWSVANETPEGGPRLDFITRLVNRARELDDTRLITAALDTQGKRDGSNFIEDSLGEIIDVIGINNYCGWYGKEPQECSTLKWASAYHKPMIMSEIGGGALQGLHGGIDERWTEEYQEEVYEQNIEMMRNIDFLAGLSPWILMDFRSARRHLTRIQGDFNRKGLISESGIKKKAFFTLMAYYQNKNPD